MSAYDAKGLVVEALKANEPENFQLSNLILHKKGPKAIFQLYGLKADLMKFAHNPEATPLLPKMPEPPVFEDGMTKEEMLSLQAEYKELLAYWNALKEAHNLKVPLNDYMHIMDYLSKYFKALYSTPGVKGLRFYAFTKNTERQEQRSGMLSAFLKPKSGGQE